MIPLNLVNANHLNIDHPFISSTLNPEGIHPKDVDLARAMIKDIQAALWEKEPNEVTTPLLASYKELLLKSDVFSFGIVLWELLTTKKEL